MTERTTKTVLISVPSIKGYSRWVYRAVECNTDQRGYRTERGVKILWESGYLYRPTTKSGRGCGPEAEQYAHEVAESHRRQVCGI